ncbi:MAG: glycoside hydrolase domain-containing protein [Nocardioides sp.]
MHLRPLLGAATLALVAALTTSVGSPLGTTAPAADSAISNPVTPGAFRGFGFDQCLAPTQSAMDTWLRQSPYLAVGIYISGASRACRVQPNLTKTWVATQLGEGWKLLAITLGPQAPCNPRFPRYGNDPVINNDPGTDGRYAKARAQGVAEAQKTVTAAQALGLVAGSTMWYDLEGFDLTKTRCRDASLAFLSAWTRELHTLHYVSGVYSSAGSGIKMLDDVRVSDPTAYHLPDQIWIARWDGVADTNTSYIRADGWRPGGRMKQYLGGHNESWGGVTINVDRDYLALGTPKAPAESHCNGVAVDLPDYPRTGTSSDPARIKTLQCLLAEQHAYAGKVSGVWNAATTTAVSTWQQKHALPVRTWWGRRAWMTLLSAGPQPILKLGSTGPSVRDLQRTLNAATAGTGLAVSGIFDGATRDALTAWQKLTGRTMSGIANGGTWAGFRAAERS